MDDGEHQRTMFVNLNIALIVLTTVAITLRFWSRAILPIEKLWLDDLFAALAFVCYPGPSNFNAFHLSL